MKYVTTLSELSEGEMFAFNTKACIVFRKVTACLIENTSMKGDARFDIRVDNPTVFVEQKRWDSF